MSQCLPSDFSVSDLSGVHTAHDTGRCCPLSSVAAAYFRTSQFHITAQALLLTHGVFAVIFVHFSIVRVCGFLVLFNETGNNKLDEE